jgi:hypothetical protein
LGERSSRAALRSLPFGSSRVEVFRLRVKKFLWGTKAAFSQWFLGTIWFARKPDESYVKRMKTTLDIPNDLYREAKATAALERIRIKDLVEEGLRLALAVRGKGRPTPSPLETLQAIRRNPLHTSGEIARLMAESRRLRQEGWSREDRA